MIELSLSTSYAAPPPLAVPVASAAPGGFARALDAASEAPPAAPDAAAARQDDAGSGKDLPPAAGKADDANGTTPAKAGPSRHRTKGTASSAEPADALPIASSDRKSSTEPAESPHDGSDDTAPGTTAAAPIIAILPIPAAPTIVPSVEPQAVTADKASAVVATNATARTAPSEVEQLPPTAQAPAPDATASLTAKPFSAGFELIDAGSPAIPARPADPVAVSAPRIEAHADTPRFAIAAAPVSADPVRTAVQPARQAFASALATLSLTAPSRRDDDGDGAAQPVAGLVAPATATLLQAAVQQAAAGDQAGLDPRHDRGLHGMIDHIEMLRDDADARDTRIRLSPDALGTVDVALRRDGDAVHVRFSSAQEATRQVLADAQPRLAVLAEARGVRIAGSSIDGGSGGSGQSHARPDTPSPRLPRAPRAAAAADTDNPGDQRLA